MVREPEEPQETTFTWPLLGALYSSVVIVVIVALFNSHFGRDLDDRIDAPARTLVAAPVIFFAFLGQALHIYPSEMAQNFWTAIVAWTACFLATIAISLATARHKTDDELRGLVYALTPRQQDTQLVWYRRPSALAAVALGCTVILNLIFW